MVVSQPTDPDEPVFFGLDGSTGTYLLRGGQDEVARLALAETVPSGHLDDIKARLAGGRPSLGVVDAVGDITDLSQTGWGVIFGARVTDAVRAALRPLLDRRRAQATTRKPHLYAEYTSIPGETKSGFLRRHGVPPSGAADPDRMPYYLLLVGDPDDIPFEFQYALDVQYAVGRIAFATLDEYSRYAEGVVAAEVRGTIARRAAFFSVANQDDPATALSARYLTAPLADAIRASAPDAWEIQTVGPVDASKERLATLLGGPKTPQFLFTASHGLAFPAGHPRQAREQGALVCGEWSGPREWHGEIPATFAFAAEDVPSSARLNGLVVFHFACYGAGTPRIDAYPQLENGHASDLGPLGQKLARAIAPRAFVAPLAQRLLGCPGGSALAVVGHVERALGGSFVWSAGGRQHAAMKPFEDVVGRLLKGFPVGAALEPLNQRYAETCAELTDAVREVNGSGKLPDRALLARLWVASTDARGYVVCGDPAVRLAAVAPVQDEGAHMEDSTRPIHIETPDPVRTARLAPSRREADGVRIDIDTRSGHVRVTTTGGDAGGEPIAGDETGEDVSFGLLGGLGGSNLAELRASVGEGLATAASGLSQAVSQLMSQVSTLEVVTYSSDDLSSVAVDPHTGQLVGSLKRRALTRLRLDGQTVAVVPEQDGQIDDRLWTIHCQLVERAQAQRTELLKSTLAAMTSLMSAVKLT